MFVSVFGKDAHTLLNAFGIEKGIEKILTSPQDVLTQYEQNKDGSCSSKTKTEKSI
jgi:hypothetical protein